MKAPWFPFYTGDFLASPTVQDMEAHAVGAYVLLLARSWQSDTPGYLEDDEYGMRRAARLSAEQWAEVRGALLKKWPIAPDKEGMRYNPRLLAEAEKQVELREMKAEAGRKSAERRAALATQRQQTGNTNPTRVEILATGDGENGNYSQPQPQPQEGKPSSTSSLRSEVAAPQEKKIGEVADIDVGGTNPESPTTELRTPGGAADVGTSNEAPLPKLTKQRGSKPLVLTGDLADLLNEGGVAERVQKMKSPLTQFEADALCAKYGTDAARQIVKEMANYGKLLANNISANLTAQKWLDKRQPAATGVAVIPSYEGRQQHTGVVHPGSVQGRLDTVAQARAELLGQLPA